MGYKLYLEALNYIQSYTHAWRIVTGGFPTQRVGNVEKDSNLWRRPTVTEIRWNVRLHSCHHHGPWKRWLDLWKPGFRVWLWAVKRDGLLRRLTIIVPAWNCGKSCRSTQHRLIHDGDNSKIAICIEAGESGNEFNSVVSSSSSISHCSVYNFILRDDSRNTAFTWT